MSKGPPIVLKDSTGKYAEAAAIARRGMASGSEQAVIRTAAEAITLAGGPSTAEERQIVTMGDAFPFTMPTDDRPGPPAALMDAIAERAAIHADSVNSKGLALEALILARKQHEKKPSDKMRDAMRDAEIAYQAACEQSRRSGSALTRARLAVDAWRREQAIAQVPQRTKTRTRD